MKKKVIIIMIVVFFFCAPLPRENADYITNSQDTEYDLSTALRTVIMPFQVNEPIVSRIEAFDSLLEEIRPVLHIKYKNVVSRVKFRPQSARMVVEELQNFFLKSTNIRSIFRIRSFA